MKLDQNFTFSREEKMTQLFVSISPFVRHQIAASFDTKISVRTEKCEKHFEKPLKERRLINDVHEQVVKLFDFRFSIPPSI